MWTVTIKLIIRSVSITFPKLTNFRKYIFLLLSPQRQLSRKNNCKIIAVTAQLFCSKCAAFFVVCELIAKISCIVPLFRPTYFLPILLSLQKMKCNLSYLNDTSFTFSCFFKSINLNVTPCFKFFCYCRSREYCNLFWVLFPLSPLLSTIVCNHFCRNLH